MPRASKTRFALLGFLCERPMSGYDIRKAIDSSTGYFWSESYGQIYPILAELEREGLVKKVGGRAGTGKRERKEFEATAEGREALRRWLAEPAEPPKARIELLVKLLFSSDVPTEVSLAHVKRFEEEQQRHLDEYTEIEKSLRSGHADAAQLPYWLITLRYGVADAEAHLAWCKETTRTLQALGARTPRSRKDRR